MAFLLTSKTRKRAMKGGDMISKEEVKEIIKASPLVKLCGLNDKDIERIADDTINDVYGKVGEVYAG